MAEINDPETLDARLFDRLADGELDEAGRRALLSRLDDIPGGWRRCALAFLEAQAWRSELRVTAGRSDVAVVAPAFRRGGLSRGVRARRAARLALALVAAFTCGWLIQRCTEDTGSARRRQHEIRRCQFIRFVVARPGTSSGNPAGWNTLFTNR